MDMAVEHKIINKTGAWYSYGDMRMAQGRDNARLFLKDNQALCDEIENKLRAELATAAVKPETSDME